MIHNKPGNSDISRIAFVAIIDPAVKIVFTKENILKAFSSTGVIPEIQIKLI